jgi:pimeloyl-ACP methyl ester carboxylesterase
MPVLRRPDAEIHYDVYGEGFPVLLFAPGGLRSRAALWHDGSEGRVNPWVDWTVALPEAGFQAIAMDQRNAGRSSGAVEADHGWHTYAADHLALMDALGIDRFAVLGGCIGGSFCLKLCEMAPDRVVAAVLQNPIGWNPEHPGYFPDGVAAWGSSLAGVSPAALDGFSRNMWAGDFVFSVGRDFARECTVPTMLLPGTDVPHPAVTSAELAELLPGVEVLTPWRAPEHWERQREGVVGFIRRLAAAREELV